MATRSTPPLADHWWHKPTVNEVALACLRRELPSEFHPAEMAHFQEARNRCVPDFVERLEIMSETSFRFGRNIRNGREVAVNFACSADKCELIYDRVVYVDVQSPQECVCLGGRPLYGTGEAPQFVGCGAKGSTDAPDYTFSIERSEDGPGLGVKVNGGTPGTRLGFLGFEQHHEVVAIDGRAVTRSLDVEPILQRQFQSLPRVIQFHISRLHRETHYVTRDVVTALSQRYHDTWRGYGAPPRCARSHFRSIWFAGVATPVDETCTDEVTKAWLSFAAAIEGAAFSRDASPDERDAPVEDCTAVREWPSMLGVDVSNGILELRYVGWIPAPR